MALLVLAYPRLSTTDFDWIQSIRAKHDALYFNVVAPHFTVVFPVSNMAEPQFIQHVKNQVEKAKQFAFVLRCAVLDKDALSPDSYVFLVPDEGQSSMVKLHDLMYTGPLLPELRLDLPYIPHIAIASARDPLVCKGLADELNAQDFTIIGEVNALDAVRYQNNKLETIGRFSLV